MELIDDAVKPEFYSDLVERNWICCENYGQIRKSVVTLLPKLIDVLERKLNDLFESVLMLIMSASCEVSVFFVL